MTETSAEAAGGTSTGLYPHVLDSLYMAGLFIALPYLALAGKGRRVVEHWKRRSRDLPSRSGKKPCIWVHGVSVGEILSARRFLGKFHQEFSDWDVVLSTTTQSGLEAGRRHYPDLQIVSYPFDFSFLVKRAFDRIRPDLVLIVEHELWPNFLWHAHARGVPVAIVNGRLSERSLRGYRWLSRVVTWPPPGIVTLCVEDEVTAAGFRKLGVAADRIRVTGNFKFDNSVPGYEGVREALGWNGSQWVLVGASTHKGEEDALLDSFSRIYREDNRSRLIIAPRHPERARELSGLAALRGFHPVLWSGADANGAGGKNGQGGDGRRREAGVLDSNGHGEVIIVDTMGELDRISSAADVVFVGGSLVPFGGHNIIAPAGTGLPVVIGPHHQNFRSVVSAFLERDALLVARNAEDLSRKLEELKRDPARARGLALRASETVALHSGASDRTLDALRPLIQALEVRRRIGVGQCP